MRVIRQDMPYIGEDQGIGKLPGKTADRRISKLNPRGNADAEMSKAVDKGRNQTSIQTQAI